MSFAVGLDRSEPLVPLTRLKDDTHPNPPAGYWHDMYDQDEDGQICTHPDGSPVVILDPDAVIIEGGNWKRVVYDPSQQAGIVSEIFESLRTGIERRISASERYPRI